MNTVNVSRIEVVQAVQNANNEVVLVLGKRTFVRVYLQPVGLVNDVRIRGRLICKINDQESAYGKSITVTSLDSVLLHKNGNHPSLFEQRLNWSQSLNFELPDKFFKDQSETVYQHSIECSFTLDENIETLYPQGQSIQRGTISGAEQRATFEPSPPLHCRAVVMRYADEGDIKQPLPSEVDLIKRYMESAFPIAKLSWSRVYIDAIEDFSDAADADINTETQTQRILTHLLQQTLAIRNEDVLAGQDRRTLYIGVLDDPYGVYGGVALDAPDFPAPHMVAVASVDNNGQLGAHEIAHLLGRQHPGVPDRKRHGAEIGQAQVDDSSEINPFGFLSNNTDKSSIHLGLDTRVSGNSPNVMHYARHFDLMTYRYPKWISDYTYTGIHQRLVELAKDTDSEKDPFVIKNAWTVIGEYDTARNSGRIIHVLKTNYRVQPITELNQTINNGTNFPVHIAWQTEDDRQHSEPVYTRNAVSDLPGKFGLFQYTVPGDNNPRCIQLRINDSLADQYGPYEDSDIEDAFKAIRAAAANELTVHDYEKSLKTCETGLALFYSLQNDHYHLRFKWPAFSLPCTTTIQCKRPDSKQWETIAVSNRIAKDVTISPEFFGLEAELGRNYRYHKIKESFAQRLQRGVSIRVKVSIGFQDQCVYSTDSNSEEEALLKPIAVETIKQMCIDEKKAFVELSSPREKVDFEALCGKLNQS